MEKFERNAITGITAEFAPIVRIDLTDEIIRRIKILIARGILKHGTKLPPERDLAQILGVGRPALRQALKTLATLGIINSRVSKGTFINASTADLFSTPMDFLMLLNGVSLGDVFEVRRAIEVELAGLASERATEQDLVQINVILKKQETSLFDPETFLAEDVKFHSAIAQASSNVLFLAILDSLSRLLMQTRRQLVSTEKDSSNSFSDHVAIFREISAHHKAGAREAMLRHLDRVYRQWQETQQTVSSEATDDTRCC